MRLRIDYFDQNEQFERLLPESGTVERKVPATDSSLTWFLVRLDKPLSYAGSTIDRFIIASRWPDNPVGGAESTSVFVLVVPIGQPVGENFKTSQFEHVVWGMANTLDE